MAHVIDGKAVAEELQGALLVEAQALSERLKRPPGLAVILVGDNPASKVYVSSKEKAAKRCGITPFDFKLPADVPQRELEALIHSLNLRSDIDGILLQLPLPAGLDEFAAISKIAPEKDVDGLTPFNQGLLFRGSKCFEPCTPKGSMVLIERGFRLLGDFTGFAGKRAVVLGRSVLVGKPVAALLLNQNCTVTVCHSKTREIEHECREADILVAAIGKPQFVKGEWVKAGAVVIDVGINRTADGKLVGDVDFATAFERAGAITPVPGGVGPMTITMLLKNTVESARNKV